MVREMTIEDIIPETFWTVAWMAQGEWLWTWYVGSDGGYVWAAKFE
jgi:hypothetical protein